MYSCCWAARPAWIFLALAPALGLRLSGLGFPVTFSSGLGRCAPVASLDGLALAAAAVCGFWSPAARCAPVWRAPALDGGRANFQPFLASSSFCSPVFDF